MFVSMTTMHQLQPMHNNPSVSIIIPTYNERNYIHEILERIQRSVEPLRVPYEIIIVDDDSLDETWNVASHYLDGHPVRVIQRKGKKGRAAAIFEGIKASNYIIVVVMGADLQHPPEILPKLIENVSGGADIVIGSRFVEPGAVQQRGLFGRTVSRGADLLARTAFRKIRSINDVDSSFFAFRKDVIAHANLNPVGNKILLEILVLGNYKSVSEIAYSVDMRTAGARSSTSRFAPRAKQTRLASRVFCSWFGKRADNFILQKYVETAPPGPEKRCWFFKRTHLKRQKRG